MEGKKMNTDKRHQKNRSNAIVNSKVKSYSNDPFFVKKADESKQFLEKHGLPAAFQKRSKNI
jgi:hypothetical protein